MGRPIKVEGNPQHPASLGATDVFAQAQVLDFYDPDRAWAINGARLSRRSTRLADRCWRRSAAKIAASRGNGFRILTGTVTSPTLAAQLDALLARYPEARWHQWQPISRDNVSKGAVLAYGQPVELAPKLDGGGRHPRHRQRSLELRARSFALRPRLRLAPQSYAHAEDEPGLCRRSRRRR